MESVQQKQACLKSTLCDGYKRLNAWLCKSIHIWKPCQSVNEPQEKEHRNASDLFKNSRFNNIATNKLIIRIITGEFHRMHFSLEFWVDDHHLSMIYLSVSECWVIRCCASLMSSSNTNVNYVISVLKGHLVIHSSMASIPMFLKISWNFFTRRTRRT